VFWASKENEIRMDTQDTSKHGVARSCPVHPHGVEEREIRTRVSTKLLAHVLDVPMVLKGQVKMYRTWASTLVLTMFWVSKEAEIRTHKT